MVVCPLSLQGVEQVINLMAKKVLGVITLPVVLIMFSDKSKENTLVAL